MVFKNILAAGDDSMKKTVEKMKHEFSGLRTGRANVALVEGIKVESYGAVMPVSSVASLSVADSRTIEIRPWDMTQLGAIEKAIMKSDLGLTPINDGKVIRLTLPSLTEERRKDMIRMVHKIAEDFKVSVRNERRQMLESVKKAEKDKQMTEDERKKAEVELQKVTDLYIKKIDEALAVKEKEIMEV